jgi:hypothetical protein
VLIEAVDHSVWLLCAADGAVFLPVAKAEDPAAFLKIAEPTPLLALPKTAAFLLVLLM